MGRCSIVRALVPVAAPLTAHLNLQSLKFRSPIAYESTLLTIAACVVEHADVAAPTLLIDNFLGGFPSAHPVFCWLPMAFVVKRMLALRAHDAQQTLARAYTERL